MKVFYLGVDVSKKKLDLCLRSNGKDILYDVIPNDLSSIKSWLTRTFEKFFLSEDSLVVCIIRKSKCSTDFKRNDFLKKNEAYPLGALRSLKFAYRKLRISLFVELAV